jgi:hypothetical protein
MRLNIKQQTDVEVDLCRTCRYATLVEGSTATQRINRCSCLGARVPFPVTSCNEWQDRSATDLWDMKQIAWVVEVKGSRPIGFLNPDQRRKNGDPDFD